VRENDVARVVVDAALRVHRTLGPGLLESVYEAALAHELRKRGLAVQTQLPVPVSYDGVELEVGFRADLVVEGLVLLELKSVEQLAPVHKKQTLSYARLLDLRLALLINFGAPLLKQGLVRIANML